LLPIFDRSRRENIIYTLKVNIIVAQNRDETAADGRQNPRISG
jgi:hypothetical protein